jgi:uncharacterized protein (DUF1697 family)
MNTYVALLRGINVGGRIIKKDELAECFEKLGFRQVRTVIQSGNILFQAEETDRKKLTETVESALSEKFKYDARVFVLPQKKLQAIVAATPYKTDDPGLHSYVIFMKKGLAKEFVREAAGLENESVEAGDDVVYWQVQKGLTLQSKVGKLTAKSQYRMHLTNRNLNTLRKMTAV